MCQGHQFNATKTEKIQADEHSQPSAKSFRAELEIVLQAIQSFC
jgi:hypothetical protein